jgi:hypothetical protein
MAEVIPPAKTPKPITASKGSELLEPGRGWSSSLAVFPGFFAEAAGLEAAVVLLLSWTAVPDRASVTAWGAGVWRR